MSFVTTLSVDDDTKANPSWRDVELAVAALDGKSPSLVTLAPSPPTGVPDGDAHMAIGGGLHDRCIVYVTEDNLHFLNLEDTSKSGSEVRVLMTAGGQEGDYREAQCVPKEWALRAAREYFERGARAADLPWVEARARAARTSALGVE